MAHATYYEAGTVFLNPHAFQFIFSNKLLAVVREREGRGVVEGSRIGACRAINLNGDWRWVWSTWFLYFYIKYLWTLLSSKIKFYSPNKGPLLERWYHIGVNLGLKIKVMFPRKMFMFAFLWISKFLWHLFLYSYQISNVNI